MRKSVAYASTGDVPNPNVSATGLRGHKDLGTARVLSNVTTVPLHVASEPHLPFALDATAVLALGFGVLLLVTYDLYCQVGDSEWP